MQKRGALRHFWYAQEGDGPAHLQGVHVVSHAAFVVVADADGRVLAITRGQDVLDWNLPGGRLEPGESFQQGAARELYEETGARANPTQLRQVMHLRRRSGEIAFFVAEGVAVPDEPRSEPFEGHVGWLPARRLLGPTCRYRADAAVVLGRAGLLGPDLQPR